MGAAAAALAIVLLVATAASAQQVRSPTGSPTIMPLFMATAPTLDRAHKNKLLVEAPCTQFCKFVVWQYKEAGQRTWLWADGEAHSNFPDTFYVRGLRPDTLYVLRALLKPSSGVPYIGNEIPTLEARTCPEQPPPVGNLHAHSAGPGWLEVRWTPPPKEQCKSHMYYQARYAPHGQYFSTWRQYGFFRSERWVHFRPTHPCAVWPALFCMLVTDTVKAGEQHVIEVRVSRFDELTPALSESRKVVVRADPSCIVNDTCVVIGAAPASVALNASASATDDVDLDDSDLPTTRLASSVLPTSSLLVTTPTPFDAAVTKAPSGSGSGSGNGGTGAQGAAAAVRSADGAASPAGDSAFGRLAPLFLAVALLALIALPAAFFWGKRRGARDAVELHMVPAWRRRLGGDGGSQPVLAEEGIEAEDRDVVNPMPGASLEVDQHGRFSWAKLPRED